MIPCKEGTRFAMTGVAGYIAPRHMKAIQDVGGTLVAAIDPFDSVGILDSYFPDCAFFTEYERFDRHLEKLKRSGPGQRIQYLTVCSPNHLHDAHIRTALRVGADAICEKPLVLNPWNLDALEELEGETGHRVWTVLQLRVHPSLVALKERIDQERRKGSIRKRQVELSYVTSRGSWYLHSWKADEDKSGGVATNIGVHFFDMLHWLFGAVETLELHHASRKTSSGTIELEHASVRWFLSIDPAFLPPTRRAAGERTYRSITIDGEEVEFSGGFGELHTEVYRRTLTGDGFGIGETRTAIELVQKIRDGIPRGASKTSHPFLKEL
jgi:UDP-N-acetyl-2-amino-2-deoxyglucuronate dehydrogenase